MRGWHLFLKDDMLTLEETKLHLRVDHDHEDGLIFALTEAASAASADYLNVDLEQRVGRDSDGIRRFLTQPIDFK